MNTYSPQEVTLVRGEGCFVYDDKGNRYLDFLCGIAVTSLGHAHPQVTQALQNQVGVISHVSNLFRNELVGELAAIIDQKISSAIRSATGSSVSGKVFFTNSGAESIECAIKLTRKWAHGRRNLIVGIEKSFHGRTLGALSATGQKDKQVNFEPLVPGFAHVRLNQPEDIDKVLGKDHAKDTLAAIILEPILGEAGVWPVDIEFARELVATAKANKALVICDEIQTGLGRTGRWFGFERLAFEPDIVTLAKSLGNGFPIGACWARSDIADAFVPSDHGSTFGGQPLACSAALATIRAIETNDLVANARELGQWLISQLGKVDGVAQVRGEGLLIGVELEEGIQAKKVSYKALTNGLIVNPIRESTIRLAPPLILDMDLAKTGLEILGEAISA